MCGGVALHCSKTSFHARSGPGVSAGVQGTWFAVKLLGRATQHNLSPADVQIIMRRNRVLSTSQNPKSVISTWRTVMLPQGSLVEPASPASQSDALLPPDSDHPNAVHGCPGARCRTAQAAQGIRGVGDRNSVYKCTTTVANGGGQQTHGGSAGTHIL